MTVPPHPTLKESLFIFIQNVHMCMCSFILHPSKRNEHHLKKPIHDMRLNRAITRLHIQINFMSAPSYRETCQKTLLALPPFSNPSSR